MNNVMTIIKKELSRFFGDRRLVFTTVLMPGLMIYLMYSLLGQRMVQEMSTAEDYVTKAYVVNLPKEIREGTAKSPVEWKDWDGNPDDVERVFHELEEGEIDLVVCFPENFIADVAAYEIGSGAAPQVEIYYNSAKSNSYTSYDNLRDYLDHFEESLVNKYDVNAGKETGSLGTYDQAPKNGAVGKMLAGLLPMLIMTFIFSGVQGVAPESIAGEKERGTMATLLVTPLKRGALAFGKVISLSIIALMSGISSFLGTILSMPKMMGDQVDFDMSAYGYSSYVLLFFVIISTVLVLVSVISIISAMANSVKEATTMMAPFMIIVMITSLLPMIGVQFGGTFASLIPLFNSVKVMGGIFEFKTDVTAAFMTIGVNLAVTCLFVGVLTKMFSSEKVMFSK